MDISLIIARAVGAFYILAAMIVIRSLVMDRLLDQALAGITLEPTPDKESRRRWLHGSTALAFGMGGAALVLLNLWAVPLFLIGAVLHAFYLLWARNAFVPEDEIEAKGRRQTINAAMLYFAASAFVCWLGWTGRLNGWSDLLALAIPAVGVLLLGIVGRHIFWRPKPFPSSFTTDNLLDEPVGDHPPPLQRVRLEPRWGSYGLVDSDTEEPRDPDLYLPEELAERVYLWSYAFHATEDDERQQIHAQFEDPEHEQLHRDEGNAIVAELVTLFGRENVAGPVYPDDIRYLGPASNSTSA